jgi:hypothetical protein
VTLGAILGFLVSLALLGIAWAMKYDPYLIAMGFVPCLAFVVSAFFAGIFATTTPPSTEQEHRPPIWIPCALMILYSVIGTAVGYLGICIVWFGLLG